MPTPLAAVILLLAGFIAGVLAVLAVRRLRRRLRPQVTETDALLMRYGRWSIAIYEGASPLALAPADACANPVIGPDDITDTEAILVADPFLLRRDNGWHLFFEIMRRRDERGVIGHATSADARDWQYRGVVLEENFHLSYPQVFEWEGECFMVPESAADHAVRLYRAVSFPDRWVCVATLLSGYPFVDATLFRHDGRWWMFVSTDGNNVLNLYHSQDLAHGWQPHPQNPVVKHDPHHARPAGRVIEVDGRLHRFAQDCAPEYGVSVFAFEITELTTSAYAERMVEKSPLLTRSGTGWNSHGMHHIDALPHGGGWIAAVDGKTVLQPAAERPAITR